MTRRGTTEGTLVVPGINPVRELLRSGVPVRRLLVGAGPRSEELAAAARARGIAPEWVGREALAHLAGGLHHQGVVALAAPFAYAPLERLLAPGCASALVLDGIQDPRNLGAILRTARAAGVGGVVLPRDRSAAVTATVVAASAGLVFGLPIVRVANLVRTMEALKREGYWLVGLAAGAAQDLFSLELPSRPALVVGAEGGGLRSLVRRTCDFEARIPMAPGVDSLNVAVAAGIAVYEVVVRRAERRS
jgi:23S rRNA (guanosine2251-2'-O)-methyltransferase